MQEVRSVTDAEVNGKRVLVRVDFNVLGEDGKIVDDFRIKAAVPTIKFLLEKEALKVTLITHVGRPEGKIVENLRVAPIEARLKELVDDPCIELLENLRFDPREESNDESYAKQLASLGDIFVNDAFAVSHRASASIVGIPKFLPSYEGLLMEKEVQELSRALTPPKGSIAIMGGAKLETKLPLIHKLAPLYGKVFVGGALANELVQNPAPNVFLPQDGVPQFEKMSDIGPKTREAWINEIKSASFVLWNGPVGWMEKGFTESTYALAQALVDAGVEAVIGGGDTAAAVSKFSFDSKKVFISTGGGATLQFLADGTLPGIEALKNSK